MKDCDFISTEYHDARRQRRALKTRASFVAGLVAVMGVWLIVHQHDIATADAMEADIAAQRDQLKVHLARKDAMVARQNRLRDRQRLIEELGKQVSLVVVFADISRRLPTNMLLTEVAVDADTLSRYAQTPQTAPESSMTPAGRRRANDPDAEAPDTQGPDIVLGGIAPSMPDILRFAAALEMSSLIERVQFEAKGPTEWSGHRAERFELTCELAVQEGWTE